MCHLDAGMTRQGLEGLGTENIDLAILENVGNLVCPAEFDTGAVKNAMILSVPEGDDKPLKYPLMFSICDVLLVNKIDVAPYFNFSLEKCIERVKKLNPNIQVFPISRAQGRGHRAVGRLAARADEGLERVNARNKKQGRSHRSVLFFYDASSLHTGRTYLKNRVQSW